MNEKNMKKPEIGRLAAEYIDTSSIIAKVDGNLSQKPVFGDMMAPTTL